MRALDVNGRGMAGPGHAVQCLGVSRACAHTTGQSDTVGPQNNLAGIATTENLRSAVERQDAAGHYVDQRIALYLGAAAKANSDVLASLHRQALTCTLHQQAGVEDGQVVAGGDQHRAGKAHVAAERDVMAGVKGHFVVVAGFCIANAVDHALDHQVDSVQAEQSAGFQHSIDADCQRAMGGVHLQQAQVGIANSDMAVYGDIIPARQHNAAALIQRAQPAGAKSGEADFMRSGLGAGVNDDVSLGDDMAAQLKRIPGVDDDVGVLATRNQCALQHGCACRVEHHIAAQRFQHARGGQVNHLIAAGIAAGIHVDAAMAAHITRNGDGAARLVGLSDIDDRATAPCINRIPAIRRGWAKGLKAGCCQLAKSDQFRIAADNRCQGEGVVAGEHQAAIIQADCKLAAGNRLQAANCRRAGCRTDDGKQFGFADSGLEIGHQTPIAGVVQSVAGPQRHQALYDVGPQIQRH